MRTRAFALSILASMLSFSACSFLISACTCRSAPLAPSASLPAVSRALEKYELPPGEAGTLPPGTPAPALVGQIDFQALYDQAGIPNTDEVESLERFLKGLDQNLPDSSKVAAAKAFL